MGIQALGTAGRRIKAMSTDAEIQKWQMGATGCKSQANSFVSVCTVLCISQELLLATPCPAAITQTTCCFCNLLFSCPSCKSPTTLKQDRNWGAGKWYIWSGMGRQKCYEILLTVFLQWDGFLYTGTYQTSTETHHLIYRKMSKYNKAKQLPHIRGTQLELKIPDPSKLNFPLWKWLQSAGVWAKPSASMVKLLSPWTAQLSFFDVESELFCNYWLHLLD